MFNSRNDLTEVRINSTSNVNIVEKRAATDESVRLLREMEQASEEKRIAAFTLKGNNFNGLVEAINDPTTWQKRLLCVFDINGKRMTAKAGCDYDDKFDDNLFIKLRDEVAQVIANEIVSDALTKAWKDNRHIFG